MNEWVFTSSFNDVKEEIQGRGMAKTVEEEGATTQV